MSSKFNEPEEQNGPQESKLAQAIGQNEHLSLNDVMSLTFQGEDAYCGNAEAFTEDGKVLGNEYASQNNAGAKYSRKDMSLGKLCRKFLRIYGKESKGQLLLDQCTQELGVERRRIYDIINILESFSVIRR